jgi:hypothetical protein
MSGDIPTYVALRQRIVVMAASTGAAEASGATALNVAAAADERKQDSRLPRVVRLRPFV